MEQGEDFDERLRKSARLLHAWAWMAELSTRPEEALHVLQEEARFLVRMGPQHPQRWREIGNLIVAYNKLIGGVRHRCPDSHRAA